MDPFANAIIMRTRIQNPYSLKIGNFLKFKAKNIIIKRPLVEQFALNQNHIRNVQSNDSFFDRYAIARPGYFLGLSTYRDFIQRSNRIIKKKRYYISKLLRRKKTSVTKLLYKIKKIEKKKIKRSFTLKYALLKKQKTYNLMKNNVKRFYKKKALYYNKVLKKKGRFKTPKYKRVFSKRNLLNKKKYKLNLQKKTAVFRFKIKQNFYKKKLKKEIIKTFYFFKGKRKYYYPRDFYLRKGRFKYWFPKKHFIKRGKRIYFINKLILKKNKKNMLYFKKTIKKKIVKKKFNKKFLKQEKKIQHRVEKKYLRTEVIPQEDKIEEKKEKSLRRKFKRVFKIKGEKITKKEKLLRYRPKYKYKKVKQIKKFELKTHSFYQPSIKATFLKSAFIINYNKKKFSTYNYNYKENQNNLTFYYNKKEETIAMKNNSYINSQYINKKNREYKNNFYQKPYYSNKKEAIMSKNKPYIKPQYINKKIYQNNNINKKNREYKNNFYQKPIINLKKQEQKKRTKGRFRKWRKTWEAEEYAEDEDKIIKKLKKNRILNTLYNRLAITRYRKLPKNILSNQFWDIIAQPTFKEDYREMKYNAVYEIKAYFKNRKKRENYKKKQALKKKEFLDRHKGYRTWIERKYPKKILHYPRYMKYPYAIFYNNIKMQMLSLIKKRMISAGQSIMHSKPKISLILFNTNTSNATTSIVRFLTRRFSLLYSIPEIIYPLIRILKKYSTGLLAVFQGRYIKRQRALKKQVQFGPASGNSFNAPLDFAQRWVTLRYGVGSVKISMEILKKNFVGAAYHFFFIAFRSEYYKARYEQRRARKRIDIYNVKDRLTSKEKNTYLTHINDFLTNKCLVNIDQSRSFYLMKEFLADYDIAIIYPKVKWNKNIPIKGYAPRLLKLSKKRFSARPKLRKAAKRLKNKFKKMQFILMRKSILRKFLNLNMKLLKLKLRYKKLHRNNLYLKKLVARGRIIKKISNIKIRLKIIKKIKKLGIRKKLLFKKILNIKTRLKISKNLKKGRNYIKYLHKYLHKETAMSNKKDLTKKNNKNFIKKEKPNFLKNKISEVLHNSSKKKMRIKNS